MKKYILIALLLAAAPAIATTPPNPCGNHGNNCDPPTTPTPGGNNEQDQSQQQGQAQGQGQGQAQSATGTGVGIGTGGAGGLGGTGGNGGSALAAGGSGGSSQSSIGDVASTSQAGASVGVGDVGSTSEANGGTSSAGALSNASNGDQSLSGTQTVANTNGGNQTASGASADGSGNADVTIGGDSYNTEGSSFVYQAAMPPAPPVFGPSSAATVSYGQCGPYKAVESAQVNGVYLGLVRKHIIPLGRTDRIVAYNGEGFKEKRFPDGRWYLEGQMSVRTTAVLNLSGSRQISVGGYGSNGGGQAGAGGGSSMQQVVSTIDLEPCVAYIQQAAEQVPVIEFKEPRVPRG